MLRRFVFAFALVGTAFGLSQCGGPVDEGAEEEVAGTAAELSVIPGFEVFCFYDHRKQEDPIVFPHLRPAGHVHDFFGNESTNADSTYETLRAAKSNCLDPDDHAAYWVPSVLANGAPLAPTRVHVYYRWGEIKDVKSIHHIPANLRMIAGDHEAVAPQDTHVIGWNCGVQGQTLYSHPIRCPASERHVMHVFFPNCWDGVNLDSSDHMSHMAYSKNGSCPSSHPVPIPRLSADFGYPPVAPSTLTLSSGSILTGHADFINAWNQPELDYLVDHCVRAGRQCGPVTKRPL